MTENEAIEELKYDCNELGKSIPCDTSWGKSFENAYAMAIKALEEVQQYRAIGTQEECRAAVEKQTAKLVIDNTPTEDSVWYQCPTCKGDLTTIRGFYCQYCGQKLHWR